MTTTTDNPSRNRSHIIDQGLFRGTVGRYASGITIITGHDDQGPIGFTCQSFYSVSVDPPVVSFSVMKTSRSGLSTTPATISSCSDALSN